jgi:hypothetical protein
VINSELELLRDFLSIMQEPHSSSGQNAMQTFEQPIPKIPRRGVKSPEKAKKALDGKSQREVSIEVMASNKAYWRLH